MRSSTQRINPQLLAQLVPPTVNSIFQTTVPISIRLEMPCLQSSRTIVRRSASANGEGSQRVVWCFLDIGGAVRDVVDVGEVARASGAKLVSFNLVKVGYF